MFYLVFGFKKDSKNDFSVLIQNYLRTTTKKGRRNMNFSSPLSYNFLFRYGKIPIAP